MHKIGILLVMVLFVLVACGPDDPPTPRSDPLTGQEARASTFRAQTGEPPTATAAAILTRQWIIGQTLTPPPSPTRPERVVTRTPTPTLFVELQDDILGNAYFATDWLQAEFTAIDGSTYTLASFADAILIIHTFDPACDFCYESHQRLREAIATAGMRGQPVVYLNLNISSTATVRGVTNWSTRHAIPMDAEANWYIGTASTRLLRMLTETFGEIADNTLIVVDKEGVSHFAPSVSYSVSEWRQLLTFYTLDSSAESDEPDQIPETPIEE